ncbi:MAG: phosphotransferase family protein [Granulosicoccus sp.]
MQGSFATVTVDAKLSDNTLRQRCFQLLLELQLISAETRIHVTSLEGGVASDIAAVHSATGNYCVKFALPKLRVEQDWYAPVHRSLAEYRWLHFADDAVPGCVPELFGYSESMNGFVMELLDNEDVYQWKRALFSGYPAREDAENLASVLGKLHQISTHADFDPSGFHNHRDFEALRTEPYLLYTASQHPAIAKHLQTLAADLTSNSTALIHGDISPKNILFDKGRAVILDAECATLGDPVFDVAFCLNHLILKSMHMSQQSDELLQSVVSFWETYSAYCQWEALDGFEQRLCILLPALMLARVDGKSPVNYLMEEERERVRSIAVEAISLPASTLAEFLSRLPAMAVVDHVKP